MKKYYPYLITVSHMINDSCQSVLPALLPLFIYTYGLSLEQAGFLILANTALSSLLQPLLGYISDKINQPRLIAFGVLLSACSTGMMGFVTSYESLLVCATLAGVGSSIFHPEGAKIMNSVVARKVRPWAPLLSAAAQASPLVHSLQVPLLIQLGLMDWQLSP